MKKKLFAPSVALLIAALYCFLFSLVPVRAQTATNNLVTAKSAILIDCSTGEILYEKKPDLALPPASTTKVMTALVALEQKPLEATMRVSKNAALAPPCKIYVRAGDQWRLDNLLRCILLNSANDASVVIAEGTSGTVQDFSSLMNRKAKEIGARNTHFANPHGLDQKGHYTTARDMALIFHHATRQHTFCDIAGTKTMTIKSPSKRIVYLRNHNRLLGTYPGMLYGKTGYTSRAQRCFVGKATRNGRELIVCVLGSQNHFRDAARLLDYGFNVESDTGPVQLQLTSNTACSQPIGQGDYVLQTASFCDSAKASDLRAALMSQGYQSFIESVLHDNVTTFYRVKVGYFDDRESAEKTRARIMREFNLDPLILR